ncbi:peptidoglycan DD-metalloendopeptidase family protein [Caulobacter sp. NIBR1757]|uniref:peptidoglycan DD-metalloendopeptidase family protein n=1 Tax=Caulobacter sp. NIBR1757 TaxID=3016000 RepID=UPI0022F046D8|nr:peptidoglycan DD-metalloendopeptidase family protein [Caulobacter sp. NIBR1757]WGM39886.1 hypothetical protein AMEJIAPC_02826 [Caulobacter sp. NIBR1757]
MTQYFTRALLLAASAAALTACATAPTPRYPVVEGQQAGTGPTAIEMPKPAYAIRQSDAPPPPPPPPPQGDAEEEAAPADEPGDVAWAPPQSEGGIIKVSNLAPPAQDRYEAPAPIQLAQNDAEDDPPPARRTENRTVVTVAGKVIAVDGKPKTWTVKSGQGLDAVARELGTTRKQLADDNKLKEPFLLKPGQVLKGPASKGKAYVVESGDTLTAVAKRFNVKVAALAEENNLTTKAAIKKGQKLRLPQGFKDSGPVKKTVSVTVDAPAPPRPRPQPTAPQPTYVPDDPRMPPSSRPPVETPYDPRALPPVQQPPVERPPVQTAPSQLPPARPPASKPPAVKPPVTTPPVVATPPVVKPPVYKPPVQQPVAPPPSSKPLPPLMPDDKPPSYTDADYARMAAGRFQWPVRGTIISPYGPRGPMQRNDGVDIGAAAGTPVVAAADGIVKLANDLPNSGLTVIVIHADGWATVYANLRSADVSMDQRVSRGQKIGVVGQSGDAPKPQLHFEVRHSPSAKYKARAIDPQIVLPR